MTVTNHISSTAKLGNNVKVWHFAYIGDRAIIGDNTKIGSLAHVDYDVEIGNDCRIEGMVYIPPKTKIGNNVFLGPNCVFTNDPYPPSTRWASIIIEDDVIVCAGAIIKAGVTIHKGSVVGMGAVVIYDVKENIVVVGNPARKIYSREEYNKKMLNWDKSI